MTNEKIKWNEKCRIIFLKNVGRKFGVWTKTHQIIENYGFFIYLYISFIILNPNSDIFNPNIIYIFYTDS